MRKAFLFLLVASTAIFAQLSIKVQPPPTDKFTMSDLWRIQIDNSYERIVRVFLHAEITQSKLGLIARANTNEFILRAGKFSMSLNDIGGLTEEWYHPDYESYIIRTGAFPPGKYAICVSAIDAETGLELAKHCFEHEVIVRTPPRPLSPKDGAKITTSTPRFTWIHPRREIEKFVTYGIKIAEIKEGQTKQEAITSNPPILVQIGIKRTNFAYPADAPLLEDGKKYVWQVGIYCDGKELISSQPMSFTKVKPAKPKKETEQARRKETLSLTESCPCCSLEVFAMVCCPEKYEKTTSFYRSQNIKVVATYCEPVAEIEEVTKIELPLKSDIMWDPEALPPDSLSKLTGIKLENIGITAFAIDDSVVYKGTPELSVTRYFPANIFTPGKHTISVALKCIDGSECRCTKEIEVADCPDCDVKAEVILSGKCSPVEAKFVIEPEKEICAANIVFDTSGIFKGEKFLKCGGLPLTKIYHYSGCNDSLVAYPKIEVTTKHKCRKVIFPEPIVIKPEIDIDTGCISWRYICDESTWTWNRRNIEIVYRYGFGKCSAICDNYKVTIDWGDGTTSSESDMKSDYRRHEDKFLHEYSSYGTYKVTATLSNSCDTVERKFTIPVGRPECRKLIDNIVELLDTSYFISQSSGLDCSSVFNLITNSLCESGILAKVGTEVDDPVHGTKAKICQILLDIRISSDEFDLKACFPKSWDIDKIYKVVLGEKEFRGLFKRYKKGGTDEKTGRVWRFYENKVGSAKINYRPAKEGKKAYFEFSFSAGDCGNCPEKYRVCRIISNLTEKKASKLIKELREGRSRTADISETSSVLFEVCVCCPPGECER